MSGRDFVVLLENCGKNSECDAHIAEALCNDVLILRCVPSARVAERAERGRRLLVERARRFVNLRVLELELGDDVWHLCSPRCEGERVKL